MSLKNDLTNNKPFMVTPFGRIEKTKTMDQGSSIRQVPGEVENPIPEMGVLCHSIVSSSSDYRSKILSHDSEFVVPQAILH